MSFREFKNQVKKSVVDSLNKNNLPELIFEPTEPPRIEYGDLSVSICIGIGNKIGEKPMEIAQKVVDKIILNDNSIIEKIEIMQPGYINFKKKKSEYAYSTLSEALNNVDYGKIQIGNNKKVGIEHTSVNPNKALHYGHLRNIVIGDSIRRILEFTGHNVQVLNYIDDSGLQIADLVVGFKHAGFPIEPENEIKFDHYCGDTVYVKVNEQYSVKKELVDAQKNILKDLENHDSENAKFASIITKRILKEQLKTCWRIGSRYDLLNFESHILQTKMWDDIFDQLKLKGIIKLVREGKNDGCWIVQIKGEKEGEDKILLRSNGTATYIAKDIPYAAWKTGVIKDKFEYKIFSEQPDGSTLWRTSIEKGDTKHPKFVPYAKAITVIDVRQGRLQRIIKEILDNLSENEIIGEYIHLSYEVVFLSGNTSKELGFKTNEKDMVSMSGRKGIYVNADDVLDKLHAKAYSETKKRNFEESEEWLNETAEKIMIAAVRFDLLKQDLDKTIVFDLNRSLALEGESGPYLQYTFARASRIIEKSNIEPTIKMDWTSKLTDLSEILLIREISKFDIIIEESVKNLSPNILTRYLANLVSLFNGFYEKKSVLKESDEEIKMGRLAIVKSFQIVVKKGLDLLGIEATERI